MFSSDVLKSRRTKPITHSVEVLPIRTPYTAGPTICVNTAMFRTEHQESMATSRDRRQEAAWTNLHRWAICDDVLCFTCVPGVEVFVPLT